MAASINGVYAINVNSIVQFLVALLMLAIVVVLCYFTTKFVANYQKGVMGKGNIEVMEAKSLGSNKMIQIVRIGDEYFAIGVSKDNVSLISKVDKEALIYEEVQPSKIGSSFSQILDKVKSTKKTNDK